MTDSIDLPDCHGRSLEATDRVVARIGDDQWELPTPNDEWNVRDVVNHVVSGNEWAAELATGATIEGVGDRLDGDLLSDDPLGAYRASAAHADAAFRRPGAMEAPAAVSYGPVPGAVYCGHRFIDVLIHGWDIAVGTNQDTTLDRELVEACWAVAEPQTELIAGSGGFATNVDADAGADTQTRLLALLGRRDRR